MNSLRLECRARNNVLWHAIFDTERSVAAFCRRFNFTQQIVGSILNLSLSPYRVSGALTETGLRLCVATGISAEELFPLGLYGGDFPRAMVAEVPVERFVSLGAARNCLLLPPTQVDGVEQSERRAALKLALSTLKPREAMVLRARFGLDDGRERTYEDIARRFRVTRERIRQVEARAMRRMRHPGRSGLLRPFIDDAPTSFAPSAEVSENPRTD